MRPSEPTVDVFSWQMELISRFFNPLSLSDALESLHLGRLPPRAVCVTFDDGYADNATIALPVLKIWNIPATVFVSSGYINGGRMWNDTVIECMRRFSGRILDLSELGLGKYQIYTDQDRLTVAEGLLGKIKYLSLAKRQEVLDFIEICVPSLPHDLMLSSQQILNLANDGIEIGGHTKNHPILATLSVDQARQEIESNRSDLTSITSRPVRYFAYPNGIPGKDYQREHRNLVEGIGFDAALSTVRGVSNELSDKFQLPRFTPWDKSPGKFMLRLLGNQRQLV